MHFTLLVIYWRHEGIFVMNEWTTKLLKMNFILLVSVFHFLHLFILHILSTYFCFLFAKHITVLRTLRKFLVLIVCYDGIVTYKERLRKFVQITLEESELELSTLTFVNIPVNYSPKLIWTLLELISVCIHMMQICVYKRMYIPTFLFFFWYIHEYQISLKKFIHLYFNSSNIYVIHIFLLNIYFWEQVGERQR